MNNMVVLYCDSYWLVSFLLIHTIEHYYVDESE